MGDFRTIAESIGLAIDAVGVLVIVIGLVISLGRFLHRAVSNGEQAYRWLRQDLGRSILLGLEFLVAGDIIRTVAVSPTLQNVYVLALIVLIRTVLSMTLQVEVDGRWPWQQAGKKSGADGSS